MKNFKHLKPVLFGALGGSAVLAGILVVLGFSTAGEADVSLSTAPSQTQSAAEATTQSPSAEAAPSQSPTQSPSQTPTLEATEQGQATANSEAEQSPVATSSPSASASPTSAPLVCSMTSLENRELVLDWYAQVVDVKTGKVLYARNADSSVRLASVMKLLTAAAALETLGPDYRVTTRVYEDTSNPGRIYLVGAGDITLSRTPAGSSSVYSNAPKLSTLVSQITSARGSAPITEIVLDSTLYGGTGEWHETWSKLGLSDGYMAPVSALQVDADRSTPRYQSSKRSETPVLRAGEWFREALSLSSLGETALTAKLVVGSTPNSAKQIASVQSRPMSEWVRYMLKSSDNSMAEAIGRLVSLDVGLDGSMGSLTKAYQIALTGTKIKTSDIFIQDGSGLSRNSKVAPAVVNQLLLKVNAGYSDFKIISAGLSVAGEAGSLGSRFKGEQTDSHGHIFGKTGWIRTGYSLAGFINAEDGTRLAFTTYNLGTSVLNINRIAMEDIVYAFYKCGSKLVNN